MYKRILSFLIIAIISLSYGYSATLDSKATLNIEAYKPEAPLTEGNLEIKVYKFGDTTAEIQGFGQEIDVTNNIQAATSSASAMTAFSIVINTNLAYNYNFKIKLNPFVSDKDGTKVPVFYSFDFASDWKETTVAGSNARYRYRFVRTNTSTSLEVGSEVFEFVNQEIRAQYKSRNNRPWGDEYTVTANGSVLTGRTAGVSATITAKMWMNADSYESILASVNYRSQVVIIVEVN